MQRAELRSSSMTLETLPCCHQTAPTCSSFDTCRTEALSRSTALLPAQCIVTHCYILAHVTLPVSSMTHAHQVTTAWTMHKSYTNQACISTNPP